MITDTADIAFVARLVLAAVFVLAGLAKLLDASGTREAVAGFGVPARLAGPAARLLPASELAVAAALAVPAWSRAGAVGALALLGGFSAAVVANLARGRQPDCHCFGQLHSAPIGAATLRRNAVLAGAAGLVLWRGPGRAPALPAGDGGDRLVAAGAALLVLTVVLLVWAVVNLLRQHGRLLLRLDALEALVGDHPGLPVGAVAPGFSLSSLSGPVLTLDDLLAAGRPVMLVFTDPACRPCGTLLPEIGRWQRDYDGSVTVAVVSRGDPEVNRAKARAARLDDVLLQADREVARAYETTATPSAVLIGEDGRIASPVVAGGAPIRNLLRRAPDVRLRPAVPAER